MSRVVAPRWGGTAEWTLAPCTLRSYERRKGIPQGLGTWPAGRGWVFPQSWEPVLSDKVPGTDGPARPLSWRLSPPPPTPHRTMETEMLVWTPPRVLCELREQASERRVAGGSEQQDAGDTSPYWPLSVGGAAWSSLRHPGSEVTSKWPFPGARARAWPLSARGAEGEGKWEGPRVPW